MPSHSIYALCEPDDGKPRYIGKTSMLLNYRLSSHVSSAKKNDGQPALIGWVRSLLDSGKKPTIVLLEECEPNDIDAAEVAWIATCVRNGCDLLNKSLLPKTPAVKQSRRQTPITSDMKLTKENQQNIAVTSAIHAQAKELAQRDSLKMYQVVAEGLRLYEEIHPTSNGDAEPHHDPPR